MGCRLSNRLSTWGPPASVAVSRARAVERLRSARGLRACADGKPIRKDPSRRNGLGPWMAAQPAPWTLGAAVEAAGGGGGLECTPSVVVGDRGRQGCTEG